MGGVISSLSGGVKTAKMAIQVLRDLSNEYSQLLDRANAPPSLPVPNPTTAYWQENPPFPELVDIRSEKLLETADVVIIGSGITGAAIARTILHECRRTGQTRRVVVCEARTLCSGATGRNGGHIKASPHESFGRLRKRMSPERAAELTRFQLQHLESLVGLCEAENIDVAECREVETVDFFLDDESFEKMVKEAEEFNKYVPEFAISTWTAEEAKEAFSVNTQVRGAMSYKAGALWPYRLVTSIWKNLLSEFPNSLHIETTTPVNSIQTNRSPSPLPYTLSTPRGQILTRHIIHATNGYTARLLPSLLGKTTSLLAQMSSQSPGIHFPDLDGTRSWSIIYGSGFDYVTQRPTSPGTPGIPGKIMLGGGFQQSPKQGMDAIGVYDDSTMDALTNAHNLGIMPELFGPEHWGPPVDQDPATVWSGVVGIAADMRPLVGRLDEQLTGRKVAAVKSESDTGQDYGEWIAAFFIGDGMVWAWLAGTALGLMVTGSEEVDLPAAPGRPGGKLGDWFPEELLPTVERVKAMDIADLAEEFM